MGRLRVPRKTEAPTSDYVPSWLAPRCPECGHSNWVWQSEKWDVEAVKCWACGIKFWLCELMRD
jgi:ribosomal protein S27E